MSRGSSRRLEIFCEDAYLWTDDDYLGPLHVETSDGVEHLEARDAGVGELAATCPRCSRRPSPTTRARRKHFLDALARRAGPAARGFPGAAEALAAHRIVDAAYRSAASGTDPSPRRDRGPRRPARSHTAQAGAKRASSSPASDAGASDGRRVVGSCGVRENDRRHGGQGRSSVSTRHDTRGIADAALRRRAEDPPGDRGATERERPGPGRAGRRAAPSTGTPAATSSGPASGSSPASSSSSPPSPRASSPASSDSS